jgi:putative serine protease PepD
MTEQRPPLDSQPSEPTPSYESEHTGVLPPWGTPTSAPPPPRRRSRAGAAGLLVAALVVGGAGGVGGAAVYDAQHQDSTTATTSTTSASTGSGTSTSTSSTAGSTTMSAVKGTPEAVAASVLPSVVEIDVVDAGGSGGSGSGVVLSSDGEILTNNHVVALLQNGGTMTVSFNDGKTASATTVGTDPVTDLAVIKARGVSGLVPAKLGNSDALRVGQAVVAIGSPFGLDATVTSGIVSSLNRPVGVGTSQGTETIYPAIQTDAAINPGNSGGPLVNLAGQVIGINSSIRTSTTSVSGEGGSIGLGFAIPISNVLPIVDQLRHHQTPTHAKLGVTVSDAAGHNGVVDGARIQSVVSGSAAEKAGLHTGDVVTRVDDHPITGLESLVATIRGYRPGDTVQLSVQRGGRSLTLSAQLDSDLNQQDS